MQTDHVRGKISKRSELYAGWIIVSSFGLRAEVKHTASGSTAREENNVKSNLQLGDYFNNVFALF